MIINKRKILFFIISIFLFLIISIQSIVYYLNSNPKIINNLITSILDRKVDTENIQLSINLKSIDLTINKLKVNHLIQADFTNIQINLWQSLWNWSVKIQNIHMNHPILHIALSNLNFLDDFSSNNDSLFLANSIIKINNGTFFLKSSKSSQILTIEKTFVDFDIYKKQASVNFNFKEVADSQVSLKLAWQQNIAIDSDMSISGNNLPLAIFYNLMADNKILLQDGLANLNGKIRIQQGKILESWLVLGFHNLILKNIQYKKPIAIPDFQVRLNMHKEKNQTYIGLFSQLPDILNHPGFQFNAIMALDNQQLTVKIPKFNFSNINYSLPLLTDNNTREFFKNLHASGYLENMTLNLTNLTKPKLTASFKNIFILKTNKNPGIKNVSGTVSISENFSFVKLYGDDVIIDSDFFKQSLNLGSLNTNFEIQQNQDTWQAQAKTIQVNGKYLESNLKLKLHSLKGQSKPMIDLSGKLNIKDISGIIKFIPANVSPMLYSFLSKAFKSGSIENGQIKLQGNLNNYPFKDKKDGEFLLTMPLKQWNFSFDDSWRNIRNMDGLLKIDNQKLTISLDKGKFSDIEIDFLSANVDTLITGRSILYIQAKLHSDIKKMTNLLLDSPLKSSAGRALDSLNLSGQTKLVLGLTIPLDGKDPVSTTGKVFLNKNSLYLDEINLKVENLKGIVEFTEEQVVAKQLFTQILGGKIIVDISTPQSFSTKNSTVIIKMSGFVKAKNVKNWVTFPLPQLTNNLMLNGKAVIISGQNNQLSLTLDASQTAFYLPNIVNKLAGEPLSFKLQNKWNDNKSVIKFTANDILKGKIIQQNGVISGGIASKNTPLTIGKNHLIISSNFNTMNIGTWNKWLKDNVRKNSIIKQSKNNNLKLSFNLNAKIANYGLVNYKNVHANIGNTKKGWAIRLINKRIIGDILVPNHKLEPIVLKLSKLVLKDNQQPQNINKFNKYKLTRTTAKKSTFIQRAINVDINSLVLNDKTIGTISFRLLPNKNGSNINDIVLENNAFRISGSGRWQKNIKQTNLSLTLTGDKLQSILQKFSYKGKIYKAHTTVKLQINWNDTPDNFSLSKINGIADIKIKSGALSDIESSSGKAIGFFNLQNLNQGISELAVKGIVFDSIKGQFIIKDGIASTNDVKFAGNSMNMDFKGTTNLATKVMDFSITVDPQVANILPAIGVYSAGTIGVMIGLLISKYNESTKGGVDKNLSNKYHLTGTWFKPHIKEE